DILLRNAHGVVVLVPAHRPKDFYGVSRIMRYAKQKSPDAPMLIAATHSDMEEAWSVEDILPALGIDPETSQIPALSINATAIKDVAQTLIALAEQYAVRVPSTSG
ncbi:MAG: GTPase, partial [Chloroherpetonaceae bacterium]